MSFEEVKRSKVSLSSSIILSNILQDESCELKGAINTFMEEKLHELELLIKSKVDTIVTDKLDKFYNKSFSDLDNILFDTINGNHIIEGFNNSQFNQTHIINVGKKNSKSSRIEINIENTQFFTILVQETIHCGQQNLHVHYFKNIIITQKSGWSFPKPLYQVFKHSLSNDLLFAIKYFNASNYNTDFTNSIKILNEHPEYFKKNCSDFEDICNKEYTEINKIKLEIQELINEKLREKEYYASLESRIKQIELDEVKIIEEKEKLDKEKYKLICIKEKLVEMKKEVEDEKKKLQEQKNKTLDIDECFEGIL
jgi:hypothetical protein